jgi:probable phosphoglycerate mutase
MRFPGGGEALREVQFRMVQALEQLARQHQEEIIVVVSHADAIKLVLAHYLGVHMDLFQRIAVSPASVSIVYLAENGAMRVLRMNDDGPLRPFEKPAKDKKKGKKG